MREPDARPVPGRRGLRLGAVAMLVATLLAGATAATHRPSAAPPTGVPPPPLLQGPPSPSRGTLLVASRALGDPIFAETVVLVLDHDANGALGVIVNRPSATRLATVMPGLEALRDRPDVVYLGGPVAPGRLLLLVRSATPPADSMRVLEGLYASGSLGELERQVRGPAATARFRVYAGCAGWGPGQLDLEVLRGEWYVAPGDVESVLGTPPAELWPRLIERVEGVWADAAGAASLPGRRRATWRS